MLDPAAGKTTDPSGDLYSWRVPAVAAGILILTLGLAGAWWWPLEPATQPTDATAGAVADVRPSIVVLPFDSMGGDDQEQAYLADGFTEDLTTELARIPGLFVISRNAAFAYKDKETKPAEIAAALGVQYLLEGSIRRVGDDMRINAQLIDAATAGHLWAERFDGQWADVFALQDRVVSSIAGALKLRLVNSQARADIAGGTSDPAAYEAYLRGSELETRNTPENIAKAATYYQQALELDPGFGTATAALAWLYWNADEARMKALGLTPDELDAKLYETLDAAAKHPSPTYYQIAAELLIRQRKSDEAITLLQKAVALNPSHPWTYEGLSQGLIFNGRPKEARVYLDAAIQVDPGWTDWRYYQAGLADFGQDRFEEAVASLEKIDFASPEPWAKFYGLQVLVSAYGHLGRSNGIAIAMEKLKKVLLERNDGEPNLLLTQQFFVFKNEADIDRLLGGLSKAGVPELPTDVDLDTKDRLTGPEIKSFALGHELRGRKIAPEIEPYRRIASADGSIRVTIGSTTSTGTTWVQRNFLCNAYPRSLTTCGAVFRNPSGTAEQQNEYRSIYRWNRFEFSVIR